MIDLLLGFGLSNFCISMLLAAVAWTVQKKTQKPLLAHLLWLLVLIKLVTPSFFTVPLMEVPTVQAQILAQIEAAQLANANGLVDDAKVFNSDANLVNPDFSAFQADALSAQSTEIEVATHAWIDPLKNTLAIIWITGSLAILGWSFWRVFRFNQLLNAASQPASAEILATVKHLARRLGLKHSPQVVLANAQIPPMVWWIGGRERIVLPLQLVQEMPADELRWLLAHEVGHVRRRDHWVRWLEWISCIAFWWNPVTWMARQHLRVNEEICCDALVMTSLRPNPKTYANSLLNAVEFLLAPLQRPPAMASEINNGGVLERRLKMIISKTPLPTTPRWMTVAILLCAVVLLPIGVAQAQEPDVNAVTARLIAAVQAGELTEAQAAKMMGVLAEEQFAGKLNAAKAHKDGATLRRWKESNKGKPGMMEYYLEMGVSNKTYEKVVIELHENGIPREILEPVMGGMIRLIHDGKGVENKRRIYAYFKELGLSDDQAKLVHKYAQKLTQALADRKVEYRNRATQLDLTRQERYRRMEDEAREQSERETVIVDTLDLAAQEVYNAISSGTISEEEGQAELRARKEEAVRSADMYARFEAAAQRIKAFVAAGRMSKEEAQESLETLKKEMAKAREGVSERDQAEIDSRIGARARLNFTFNTQDQQRPITRGEYGNIADELTAAVDAGKISREDARARLNVLEQRMREQHNEQQDRITSIKQRVDVAVEKIRAAVKSGHISAEEGRGELMELRQKLAEIEAELAARDEYRQLEPRVERLRLLEDREVALKEKDMKMEYEVVMQQIRKAVAAGEMTREDATKKLAKMKEAMNKASGSDGEE